MCTPVRSLQPTLRKCPSNQSQGLRDEQRKHQRSFEQKTSILATRQVSEKDKKDQLESTKTFLDTGAFFVCLEGVFKEPQHSDRSGEFQERESALSSPRYSRKEAMHEEREDIISEGQRELRRRMDQFMGCNAQQQTTMTAILDRLDYQHLEIKRKKPKACLKEQKEVEEEKELHPLQTVVMRERDGDKTKMKLRKRREDNLLGQNGRKKRKKKRTK